MTALSSPRTSPVPERTLLKSAATRSRIASRIKGLGKAREDRAYPAVGIIHARKVLCLSENPLKLRTIQESILPIQPSTPEEDFARSCGLIESGDWDEAYELLLQLRRMQIDPELAYAAKVASEILNPRNSSKQKAERILQLFPGRVIRVYDQENGWSESGLRELRDGQT